MPLFLLCNNNVGKCSVIQIDNFHTNSIHSITIINTIITIRIDVILYRIYQTTL